MEHVDRPQRDLPVPGEARELHVLRDQPEADPNPRAVGSTGSSRSFVTDSESLMRNTPICEV